MKLYLALVFVLLLSGCSNDESKYQSINIERFDIIATGCLQDSTFKQLAPALNALRTLYGDSAKDSKQILDLYNESQATKVFGPDVCKLLPDLTAQEAILGKSFSNIKRYFPDTTLPAHIYGYITPYMQSVVLVDSVMFIGLNHYLGENYPGYDGFDDYKRKVKVPSRIAIDATEALLYSNYPYLETDRSTVLSRMLYEGVMINALNTILPDASVAEILGYSNKEWEWAENNEAKVWKLIAEKKLLYTSDPIVITKLMSPAPNSAVVASDAPGRIGRYIGYKIINSYLKKHNGMNFKDMLDINFYNSQKTLIDAEYLPK